MLLKQILEAYDVMDSSTVTGKDVTIADVVIDLAK